MYEQTLLETSLLIPREYPWANINYTLHGVLHHSLELIARNDGVALGALSEEGVEANNKDIRIMQETHCRKTSPTEALTDVMGRLLERSDPYIIDQKMRVRPAKRICEKCGSRKHTTALHDKTHQLDPYSELVNNLLYDSL